MREQRGKNYRLLGALLVLLAFCAIPSVTARAETLEDQVVQTVRFGEFDEFTRSQRPIVMKVVFKTRGMFELDFSPNERYLQGQLCDSQGMLLKEWTSKYSRYSSISSPWLDEGTYYLRVWSDHEPNPASVTYFARFTPSSSSDMEICISMKKGKSVQLGTIFTNSKDKKVTWSSSKKSVAAVSSTGKVTAKKKGTTIIKVFNSSGLVSKIKVKVTG